jgi:hypothetical protein
MVRCVSYLSSFRAFPFSPSVYSIFLLRPYFTVSFSPLRWVAEQAHLHHGCGSRSFRDSSLLTMPSLFPQSNRKRAVAAASSETTDSTFSEDQIGEFKAAFEFFGANGDQLKKDDLRAIMGKMSMCPCQHFSDNRCIYFTHFRAYFPLWTPLRCGGWPCDLALFHRRATNSLLQAYPPTLMLFPR